MLQLFTGTGRFLEGVREGVGGVAGGVGRALGAEIINQKEAIEAEAAAAARCDVCAKGLAHDAAGLPFGVVGELGRKLGPTVLALLLLFMGFRHSFPARQREMPRCILAGGRNRAKGA